MQQTIGRSASFFLEPSYFAQFLFPYIALKMFTGKPKDLRAAVVVSLIVFLTKTGNGVLLLVLLWGGWLLYSNYKLPVKIFGCLFTILLAMTMFVINSDMFDALIGRSVELTSTSNTYKGDGETSGFIRIFRGYYL